MPMVLRKGVTLLLIGGMISGASGLDRIGSRNLEIKSLAGYEPMTDVSSEASLDRDQEEIERLLGIATSDAFGQAQEIYEKGAFSKPMAKLTLDEGLLEAIPMGTPAVGTSENDTQASVMAAEDYDTGVTEIMVEYAPGTNCHVGGLSPPETTECLVNTGTLAFENVSSVTASYTYNTAMDNVNGISIQRFSTDAENLFTGYPDYMKFVEYYGAYDYGDQWVTASFESGKTNYDRGNADFSGITAVGLTESIEKGCVFINVFMKVIGEMERALGLCADAADPMNAWDRAVAFYVGGDENNLLFRLADKRCSNYATCGPGGNETEGTAKVNLDLIDLFTEGQADLKEEKCDDARAKKERIVQIMTIPLLQGAMRYNFIRNFDLGAAEKIEVEGAVFTASVVPFVFHCNQEDAAVILENSEIGSREIDYSKLRGAFENNYECLGVTCEDIGGLYDKGAYIEGAEPCEDGSGSAALGASILVAVVAAVNVVQFLL